MNLAFAAFLEEFSKSLSGFHLARTDIDHAGKYHFSYEGKDLQTGLIVYVEYRHAWWVSYGKPYGGFYVNERPSDLGPARISYWSNGNISEKNFIDPSRGDYRDEFFNWD